MISYNLTLTKAELDERYYLVREADDKDEAANMLAKIVKFIERLSESLKYERPEYHYKLERFIKNIFIAENGAKEEGTSYSVNKGDEMVLCIRNEKGDIHNYNLIVYVVLHELAHIICDEYGHTQKFKEIFHNLAKKAVEIGEYQKINFENNPHQYCKIVINNSII